MKTLGIVAAFACWPLEAGTLHPSLEKLKGERLVRVIVQYKSAPTAEDEKRIVEAGGEVYRRLPGIRALACRTPARTLKGLASSEKVKHVSRDEDVTAGIEVLIEGDK